MTSTHHEILFGSGIHHQIDFPFPNISKKKRQNSNQSTRSEYLNNQSGSAHCTVLAETLGISKSIVKHLKKNQFFLYRAWNLRSGNTSGYFSLVSTTVTPLMKRGRRHSKINQFFMTLWRCNGQQLQKIKKNAFMHLEISSHWLVRIWKTEKTEKPLKPFYWFMFVLQRRTWQGQIAAWNSSVETTTNGVKCCDETWWPTSCTTSIWDTFRVWVTFCRRFSWKCRTKFWHFGSSSNSWTAL